MWWFVTPRIVFGDGALEAVKTIEGKRVVVITDKTMSRLGFVDKVSTYLKEAGIEVRVFDEVEAEPSIETAMRGAEVVKEFAPDWVLGLGGGSCMDAAKAIWVLYERPDLTLEDINPFTYLGLRKRARLVTIPSTSGTGSEATGFVVLTSKEEHRKVVLGSGELVADMSVVDPTLPTKMPQSLTADTGLDALTHAIEAYVCTWRNEFVDGLAIRSIQLIFEYLPRAYLDGTDMLAREKMHYAATLGGIAISNAETGLSHAMGHALGGLFKVPHGSVVSVLLPYTIQFIAKKAPDRYAEIARAIDIKAKSEREASRKLVTAIRRLTKRLCRPTSIKEFGISAGEYEAKLDELVSRAMRSDDSTPQPRIPTAEQFRKMYLYAYQGKNIDF